jgi:ABC-type antimicrobial peptide transport system permease subunit
VILTLLLIGLPLGFVAGVTRRLDVLVIGAGVTLVGWWILIFTVGSVAFSFGALALTTLAALGNLVVGTFVGWALGAGLRALFGMTTER